MRTDCNEYAALVMHYKALKGHLTKNLNSIIIYCLSHNRGRPPGENVVNRRRFIELREMASEQL